MYTYYVLVYSYCKFIMFLDFGTYWYIIISNTNLTGNNFLLLKSLAGVPSVVDCGPWNCNLFSWSIVTQLHFWRCRVFLDLQSGEAHPSTSFWRSDDRSSELVWHSDDRSSETVWNSLERSSETVWRGDDRSYDRHFFPLIDHRKNKPVCHS